MGVLYLAFDPVTEREVALSPGVDNDDLRGGSSRSPAGGRLQHPNTSRSTTSAPTRISRSSRWSSSPVKRSDNSSTAARAEACRRIALMEQVCVGLPMPTGTASSTATSSPPT
jgi:hypothetical protein